MQNSKMCRHELVSNELSYGWHLVTTVHMTFAFLLLTTAAGAQFLLHQL